MLIINNLDPNSKLFKGIDLCLPDAGLVFMCGKKESSLRQLVQYIGGFAYSDKLLVSIDDHVINKDNMADYRLKYMGYMAGNSQYVQGLTVYENVMTSSSLFYKELTDEYVDKILKKCHLLKKKNDPIESLSELELHYVDLARAMMKDPKVIMVNNPIGRLNDKEQEKIWKLLKEISKDYLVIVVNAIHGVAKQYADLLVSIEAIENNHVITNKITVTEYNKLPEVIKEPAFVKTNKFDGKTVWKLSNNLFFKAWILIAVLIVGMSVFFISMAATSDSHKKFAESLKSYDVTSVVLTRNTEKDDYSIPEERIKAYESISSDIVIDWGYYFRYNVVTPGKFTAHLNNYSKIVAEQKGEEFNSEQLYFEYPNAMFEVKESAKSSFNFVAGSWKNQTKGVYISKSFAEEYVDYYNTYAKKYADSLTGGSTFGAEAKGAFSEGFEKYGYEEIASLTDLVGKHLLFGYASEFDDLEVAGIFEDNSYLDSIVFTSSYTFPQNSGVTVSNFSSVYSIGIATLSDDVNTNTKFLDECATIIRNEKEFLYAATDLDYFYTPIYTKLSNVPSVLNVIAIIFIVLVIAASAVLSYVQLSTYLKELALARTYGLKKPQVMRVALVFDIKVLVVSFVGSVILANLVCFIINVAIRAKFLCVGILDVIMSMAFSSKHAFIPFNMFSIPWQTYLILAGVCVVFGVIFYVISKKMLQQKDMYLY